MNKFKYNKECDVCSKTFSTNRKEKKYCSEKCRREKEKTIRKSKPRTDYKKKGEYKRTCKICNTAFSTIYPNKKYCSTFCADKAQKAHLDLFKTNKEEKYKERKKVYINKNSTKKGKSKKYKHINNNTKDISIKKETYGTRYTEAEDIFLLDNWDDYTKEEIAKILNRTYASVHSRYKKLAKL